MSPQMPSPDDATDPRQEPQDALRQLALAWFVRRQDAGWNGEKEHEFQAWLTADPCHPETYAQCDVHWQRFDGMPDDLLQQMRHRLERDKRLFAGLAPSQATAMPDTLAEVAVPSPPASPVSRRRFLQPVLAATAVVSLASIGFVTWQDLQAQAEWVQAFSTQRGQQKEISLPDGSRLRLGTATRVEVSYYRQRREVRLIDGEAVFDVQPDAERRFHVLAGPLRVTVVGTRFSVRHTPALPSNNGVRVAVEHGRVRVAQAMASDAHGGQDGPAVFLDAGQQLASDAGGVLSPVEATPTEGIAAWRNHRVSFLDTPLDQALAELDRYGPTGLVVRQPEVAALRLTGTFDPGDPAALRRALPRVLPVRLRQQGEQAELVPVDS